VTYKEEGPHFSGLPQRKGKTMSKAKVVTEQDNEIFFETVEEAIEYAADKDFDWTVWEWIAAEGWKQLREGDSRLLHLLYWL
jgi:hypothetical protein